MTKEALSETAAFRGLLSETADTHLLAKRLGFLVDRQMALSLRDMTLETAAICDTAPMDPETISVL